MKALVLEEYNKLVYKDVPNPVMKSDEVLVRIKACGICGSDVHGLDGRTGRRIPPLIMGHEASGEIEEVGSDVKEWKKGDRVTFDSTVYPLNDWYTLDGKYNLSDNREVIGVSPGDYRRNGAFAEYLSIPSHILYRIPDTVTYEQAAMVEAVAVALHAVNISKLRTGEKCLVVGAGMIGISLIKLLKLSGASLIISVDINNGRLEQAKLAGADIALNSEVKEIQGILEEHTQGRGVDVSFEAVGSSSSFKLSIDALRKGGRAVLVGNLTPTVEFPLQKVVTHELQILGSCAIRGEYEIVLNLLKSGKLMVDDQISVIAPLSEGAVWFDRLYGEREILIR